MLNIPPKSFDDLLEAITSLAKSIDALRELAFSTAILVRLLLIWNFLLTLLTLYILLDSGS